MALGACYTASLPRRARGVRRFRWRDHTTLRSGFSITGGAGFLGSHLLRSADRRRSRGDLRRQLLYRNQAQHRASARQSRVRTGPPRRDVPALHRGGRDLQSRLPRVAGSLPARSGPDDQDFRSRRHQHARAGEAAEGARSSRLRRARSTAIRRFTRRPRIIGVTSIRSERAVATTKASVVPKPCSSTTIGNTGFRSRSRAFSTLTGRECIRPTGAWFPTSSSRRFGASRSPSMAKAPRPGAFAMSTI